MFEVAGRSRRADAQNNYDALLSAGRDVFTTQGIDSPFDEVARVAGVGRATLYRNFPTREHLFAVLVQEQLAVLEERAREFLDHPNRGGALEDWIRLYDRSSRAYSGMSHRLASAVLDERTPVSEACAPMHGAFEALFLSVQRDGAVRADVTAAEVLSLVASLPADETGRRSIEAHLRMVLSGLRAGA